MRRLTFGFGLAALLSLSGCLIGSDLVRDEVKGDYCISAMEAEEQTSFIDVNTASSWPRGTVVGPTVTQAGWDNNWVLIEQVPEALVLPNQKLPRRVPGPQFYIFSLGQEKLFGPYNHQKFVRERVKLGVPATLDLNRRYAKP